MTSHPAAAAPAAHTAPATRSAPALHVGPHPGYAPYRAPYWPHYRQGWYRSGYFGVGFYYPYPYSYIYPAYAYYPAYGYAAYPPDAPTSIGVQVLQNYQLRQTPCGPPNLVAIWTPSGTEICALPNDFLGPGSYSLDPSTLTIYSR